MENILSYLKSHDNFIITSHISPDGDNIGSCIALNRFLRNFQKNSFHILDDDIPNNLNFITNKTEILSSEKFLNIVNGDYKDFTVISLDCANIDRLCIDKNILKNCKILNIDHHISNEKFGFINAIFPKKSSTCEIIFDLISNFGENYFDDLISNSIYSGISTDTGHFKFENTTEETFLAAYHLLKYGADNRKTVVNLYQSNQLDYLKLKSDIILNHLEIINNICLINLNEELLKKYSIDMKDTEDVVNIALNIEGIELGVLLKEKGLKLTKGSLRSKEKIDVNLIASKLGGGGHKRAAGFTLNMNIKESKQYVINLINENLKNEWNY